MVITGSATSRATSCGLVDRGLSRRLRKVVRAITATRDDKYDKRERYNDGERRMEISWEWVDELKIRSASEAPDARRIRWQLIDELVLPVGVPVKH
jgi:hypothetical protein